MSLLEIMTDWKDLGGRERNCHVFIRQVVSRDL